MNNSKVALVTGASSGIGEAIAERLAAAGYTVYGTSRRGPGTGKRAFEMLTLDVTSNGSVEAVVNDVMRRSGRIDLLVNNAGFSVGLAGDTSLYSLMVKSGSSRFASNCVFVTPGSTITTRTPRVRSSWSSDSE